MFYAFIFGIVAFYFPLSSSAMMHDNLPAWANRVQPGRYVAVNFWDAGTYGRQAGQVAREVSSAALESSHQSSGGWNSFSFSSSEAASPPQQAKKTFKAHSAFVFGHVSLSFFNPGNDLPYRYISLMNGRAHEAATPQNDRQLIDNRPPEHVFTLHFLNQERIIQWWEQRIIAGIAFALRGDGPVEYSSYALVAELLRQGGVHNPFDRPPLLQELMPTHARLRVSMAVSVISAMISAYCSSWICDTDTECKIYTVGVGSILGGIGALLGCCDIRRRLPHQAALPPDHFNPRSLGELRDLVCQRSDDEIRRFGIGPIKQRDRQRALAIFN